MSSIYITEPPTKGKIVLRTTLGDIEIELWPKEAPKAVRNFVQLAMEGYYNATTFHRIVPNFIVQGGDRTGTGRGGVCIYEKMDPEYHSRLRFSHRGIVAMADDNRSQFFISLSEASELNNKHTIFGKVVGQTLYNVLKVNDMDVEDERPAYPPIIHAIDILSFPFDDIVPREDVPWRRKEQKIVKDNKKDKIKAVKNKGLLSFGDEEEEPVVEIKVQSKSAHDLTHDPKLSKRKAIDDDELSKPDSKYVKKAPPPPSSSSTRPPIDIVEQKLPEAKEEPKPSTSSKDHSLEIQKLKEEIRGISQKSRPKSPSRSSKSSSLLESTRSAFLTSNSQKVIVGKRKGGEDDTLAALQAFQKKLSTTETKEVVRKEKKPCKTHNVPGCESCVAAVEEDEEEVDETWFAHELKCEKDLKGKDLLDPNARVDRVEDLVVIDPRARKFNKTSNKKR